MQRVTGYGVSLLAIVCAASSAWAGPIEDLQPGYWYEVPNSHLENVLPSPLDPDAGDPANVTIAWSGGAYDTFRDRLMVWGGGHSDYGGNEVYAFSVNTLTWSRIWGPSADIPPMPPTCSSTYSDGNPCSRHTYDGLQYLPDQDRFWISGGSFWCGSGSSAADAFTLNLATGVWTRRANPPWTYLELGSDYDPVTHRVYMVAPVSWGALTYYNPATDTYSQIGTGGDGSSSYMTSVIDPVRRLFISVGTGYNTPSRNPYVYNIALSNPPVVQQPTSGNGDMNSSVYPGLVFDPVSDRVIGWDGGGSVYSLNTTTWVWTKINPNPASPIPPGPTVHGTFGRFAYIPSKNAFIVVNRIDQNVWIYKLSAGGGPPPDVVSPAKTTDLRPR